jgi:divalent metal cation (Fe/Co/Zn/Cd) transporter
LGLATLAVGATMLTGNLMFDAAGTIVIGVLLIVVAVMVAIEVKALLIGQGIEPRRREALMAFLSARPEVAKVLNLITLQMGPDVMVAIKARMLACESDQDLIDAINTVEAAIKAEFNDIRWSFFEPDNAD